MKDDVAFLLRLSVLMLIAWTASVWVLACKRDFPVAHVPDWPISMSMIEMRELLVQSKDALAALQSIVTILAIIIGGLVAYIKLVKGRLFSNRLEPAVGGSILQSDQYACVKVVVNIKNVGLTRVDIDLESSSLELELYCEDDYQPTFHGALWNQLGVVRALLYHEWVEPGEAFSLRRRNEWNALAVATLDRAETGEGAVHAKLMGWTAPAPRHRCAITWSSLNATPRGAVRHANYHHWSRSGQEPVPSARG